MADCHHGSLIHSIVLGDKRLRIMGNRKGGCRRDYKGQYLVPKKSLEGTCIIQPCMCLALLYKINKGEASPGSPLVLLLVLLGLSVAAMDGLATGT